jgi:Group 4 capsule polysaccharide lipoprotein gfcB, YjbF
MGAVLAMKGVLLASVAAVLAGCQQSGGQIGGAAPASSAAAPNFQMVDDVLQIEIPSRAAKAFLNKAGANGDVVTWVTVDNISLSFRQGVVVATRGLGFDLMTADARGTLAALSGAESGAYQRQMRYLTGDHKNRYLRADCTMITANQTVMMAHEAAQFDEICVAGEHSFVNRFWVTETGVVVASEQWISPEIGIILTRKLD